MPYITLAEAIERCPDGPFRVTPDGVWVEGDEEPDLRQRSIRSSAKFAAAIFGCDPDLLMGEAEVAHDEFMDMLWQRKPGKRHIPREA